MAAALLVAVLFTAAPPASAHAVLLRTDPAAQSTVPRSPDAVRLYFSEPVDAVFGGVRLFDVDGQRVGDAAPRHPKGTASAVELPVPHLADGTYTVTWRVVSSDGHAVRGGFVFYVGAPSAISSVAVAGERPASAAVSWAAGIARLVWFLAFSTVLGVALVRRFVWSPAAEAAATPEAAGRVRTRSRHLLPVAWVLLASATVAALGFEAAKVSGLPVGEAFRSGPVRQILEVSYGRTWRVEAVLVLLLAVPVTVLSRRRPPPLAGPDTWLVAGGLLAAGIALTSALNGHARTDAHPVWATTAIVVHLLVAAAWTGGVLALVTAGPAAFRAVAPDRRSRLLREVLRRFSPPAVGAVVVLVLTGTVTSVMSFGAPSDLWRYAYGRLVLAKIVLLAGALALAARHLLVLPRRAEHAGDDRPVRSFRLTSTVEATLLVGALALAAALVDQVPGRTRSLAARGPASLERRAGADTVELFVDPTGIGTNEVHLTFTDPSGLADAAVTNVAATLTGPLPTATTGVALQLVAPAHFAGDMVLPAPGHYEVRVRTTAGAALETTFKLTVKEKR